MKIVVIGIPYFVSKVTQNLSDFDKNNVYVSVDISSGRIEKMKFIWHILFSDSLYVIGGSAKKSRAISIALFLKKNVIMHWVGSDVLLAMQDSILKKVNYKSAHRQSF